MPLASILPHLPDRLCEEIRQVLTTPMLRSAHVAEVRLRKDRVASLSLFQNGRLVNLPLSFCADGDALKETFSRAAGGSLYAFEEALKEGYLPLPHGVRVGVAGKAVCCNDSICSILSIDSLVFRLPSGSVSADALFSFYKKSTGGILLFAPPGGGKTTLLRSGQRGKNGLPSLTRVKNFSFAVLSCCSTALQATPRQKGLRLPCAPSRPSS